MVSGATSRAGGIPIRIALVLALALTLAGCLSPDEPVESGTIEDPAPAETASAASGTSATAASEAAAQAGTSAQVAKEFPISFVGNTGTWVCAPSGPNACTGTSMVPPANTFIEPEFEGTPTAAEITLTWSATTPVTSTMYIYLGAVRSCGERCFESDETMFNAYVSGASPLTLTSDAVKLNAGETLFLHVGVEKPTPRPPSPIYANYGLDQAFSVEGTLTAMVNATA